MTIIISPQVLFTLICQAVEPFRQETYGYLIISPKGQNQMVEGTISYQTANRKGYYKIEDSMRAERVFGWAGQTRQVVDGFHSHTYSPRQQLCAKPTDTDIEDMTKEHFEIICALQKTKRRYNKDWYEKELGLAGAINGYRFLLRCWKKIGAREFKELKLKVRK